MSSPLGALGSHLRTDAVADVALFFAAADGTIFETGDMAGANAPYLQLLACEKS